MQKPNYFFRGQKKKATEYSWWSVFHDLLKLLENPFRLMIGRDTIFTGGDTYGDTGHLVNTVFRTLFTSDYGTGIQ